MTTPEETDTRPETTARMRARAQGAASMHINDTARQSIEETKVLLNDLARLTSQFPDKPE